MKHTDQYGKLVDVTSLIVLDVMPQDCELAELRKIEQADWYEVESDLQGPLPVILVPADQLPDYMETSPLDAGINFDNPDEQFTVRYIGDNLKRWSTDDGFYHA